MRQLVFVHGRAQQDKDADALKAEWIEALEEGMAKSGLALPVDSHDIRFPYYGDTLFQLSDGVAPDEAARVIVRGDDTDDDEKRFARAVIEEIQARLAGAYPAVAATGAPEVRERGILNWEWVQRFLKAVDRHVPHGSGTSIALFTHDVYQYLKNPGIRGVIDAGVAQAFPADRETVVVAHSLGTVVAYNLLRAHAGEPGWNVSTFITLGSPLGVTEIRNTLRKERPLACPDGVERWFNAMDERDVVALYPLTPAHFPVNPPGFAIENRTDVRNKTRNRHGIAGYLDDPWVAARIHEALTR